MAKQTLFEARDKISYEAFVDLNNMIVDKFYSNGDVQTYKSYTLFGVDGSLFQAPQGALNTFGGQKSAESDDVCAQAHALAISDLLNRIMVHATLNPVDKGERKIFLETLSRLRYFERLLLIFDCDFYSKKLAEATNEKGVSFLFRIKNYCQKAIDGSSDTEQIVTVGDLKLRIINIVLPTGEVEKLASNIFDESFDICDFAAIYEKRWGSGNIISDGQRTSCH